MGDWAYHIYENLVILHIDMMGSPHLHIGKTSGVLRGFAYLLNRLAIRGVTVGDRFCGGESFPASRRRRYYAQSSGVGIHARPRSGDGVGLSYRVCAKLERTGRALILVACNQPVPIANRSHKSLLHQSEVAYAVSIDPCQVAGTPYDSSGPSFFLSSGPDQLDSVPLALRARKGQC